ncbi:S-adenosyl-L-methionine-dependent methyltransferase, partial [Atractiella rhizophila]
LRADHSLLGGLWIDEKAVLTAESIYTTFLLQEAVRLVERSSKEGRERGLVIGLGTGISARSLQALGVNTTIVELDPVVYNLARKYFGVEEPEGGVYIQDAREYLEGLTKYRRWKERKFDYIIHDVFTGGMVPAKLFTMEFFKLVKEVLAVHGVIAVNFAGEIKAEPSQIVLQTLLRSFRGNCRAFEDGFQAHDEKQDTDEFKNMVVFCINTPIEYGSAPTLTFRDPTPEDFLTTVSPQFRRRVLTSFKQNEMDLNSMIDWKKPMMSTDKLASKLDKVQSKGAYKHWPVMRGVFPDEIWRWY